MTPEPLNLDLVRVDLRIEPEGTPLSVVCTFEDGSEIRGHVRSRGEGGNIDWDLQFGRGDAVDIDTEICVPTLVYKKPTLFHLVTDSPSSFKLYDFRLTTPSP